MHVAQSLNMLLGIDHLLYHHKRKGDMMPRFIDWRRGRPAEIWARSEIFIKDFIKKNGLKPVSDIYLDPVSAAAGGVIIDGMVGEYFEGSLSNFSKEASLRWPIPFPGGLKGPHVHFQEKVFFLNDKQWRNFSNGVIKDIQEKLSRANEIGFQELIEISEAVSGLP